MKLNKAFFARGAVTRVIAAQLLEPQDDWTDTMPLSEFLSGMCRHHPFGCGSVEEHRAEWQLHADAFDIVVGQEDLRREPGVAKGSTAGHHVIIWKLDENGTSFRTGRVRDLDFHEDYVGHDDYDDGRYRRG